MSKFIIENNAEIPDVQAMTYVSLVMELGMISGEGSVPGPQYCYVSKFASGCIVSCVKRTSGTQRFEVYKEDVCDPAGQEDVDENNK